MFFLGDNCAKSYKLLCNNSTVYKNDVIELFAYLEYGDSYLGVYNVNDFVVDGVIPSFLCGASDEILTLNISNSLYSSKTDNYGRAVFRFRSDNLSVGFHNFTITHDKSNIATAITSDNYTLKVNEMIPEKVNKASKKKIKKKNKNKSKKNKNKSKKNKNKSKKNKKSGLGSKVKYKKTRKSRSKVLFSLNSKFKSYNIFKNKKGNPFLSWLRNGYNGIRNFLDIPLFKIPNYKKTLKSWGFAGSVVGFLTDFIFGINSKGELTVGNLLLNIISLVSGAGFFVRGAKLLSGGFRLGKYLPKVSKIIQKVGGFLKNSNLLNKGWNYIKNIPKLLSNSWNGFKKVVKSSNNKYVMKFVNNFSKLTKVIINNKHVKKSLNSIKKFNNFVNELPNKGWNILVNEKNKLIKKYNQIKNTGKKYLKKGIKYIHDKKKYFSYNFNQFKLKNKKYLSNFNNIISMSSDIIGFVSNPSKKVFSKIFKNSFSRVSKHYRKLMKSRSISKKEKTKLYKRSLVSNSIKTYYYNPIRSLYTVLFPNVNSIKKNVDSFKNFAKKVVSIKSRSKQLRGSSRSNVYRKSYNYSARRSYTPKLKIGKNPFVNFKNKINKAVGKFVNVGKSAYNKLKNFARRIFF